MQKAQVVKLDRSYPLVRCEDGRLIRCERATALLKEQQTCVVIGDFVDIAFPKDHDKTIIVAVLPRTRIFVRKDPTERTCPQVLAANFDRVFVAQSLTALNVRRLERELVLAHETGASVTVLLTKADLAQDRQQISQVHRRVCDLVGPRVQVLAVSLCDAVCLKAVGDLVPKNTTAILIGKSGVGKSSLVNALVGADRQATMPVRKDGKGRHTTVSREMLSIPNGGSIVDMPGVRGLGLWDADEGIKAAFADIEQLAKQCRFRDCCHVDEPGCAVRAAVEAGEVAGERLASYQALKQEMAALQLRREKICHMHGEKASDRKHNNASTSNKSVGKNGRDR